VIIPSPAAARAPETLDAEARKSLASLGYVSAGAAPIVRKGAPRPADMVGLFAVIDRASGLFVAGEYGKAVPLLQQILERDPFNLDAVLRLATAHSALGREGPAMEMFRRAAELAPGSPDVRMYTALHYARGRQWPLAEPLLEEVLKTFPDRVPAVEAMATVRERQGRVEEAVSLRQRLYTLRPATAIEWTRLGELAMSVEQTAPALESFERARALDPRRFRQDLELGVLYLSERRFPEALDALDRVPASHPGYPMALFKRAQVSVLLTRPADGVLFSTNPPTHGSGLSASASVGSSDPSAPVHWAPSAARAAERSVRRRELPGSSGIKQIKSTAARSPTLGGARCRRRTSTSGRRCTSRARCRGRAAI